MKMKDEVATGQQLNFTMQQSNLFPNMATQMVQICEESGALDAMCAKVADFYEAEVDALVDTLSSRSEEHTSELQSLMRISYAVFCLKQKNKHKKDNNPNTPQAHDLQPDTNK